MFRGDGSRAQKLENRWNCLNSFVRGCRITNTKKFQHISPVLRKLHWIPVIKRIEFKILTITHKALNEMGPSYIYCRFITLTSARFCINCITGLSLVVPIHQTQAYGACSFPVDAPTVWNSLPVDIENAQTLPFKRN